MRDDRRRPPPTAEGWYALHDFRAVDWDAWRTASESERSQAIEEGKSFLEAALDVDDAEEGASALYAIVGHGADLLLLHLRPTLSAVERLERRFERTRLGAFTERATSYVSVTEASGYSEVAHDYIAGDLEDDAGVARYVRSRLYPEIPDDEHVCFYPMNKRRDPEYNWYDLPFEERAEHMDAHGVIGKGYLGDVTQMITGSIGLDDYEWGVTLWADDLVDVKELLYEMRFDPSTSKFAEFGSFYVGRRLAPAALEAYFAGERVPTDEVGQESSVEDTGEGPSVDEEERDGSAVPMQANASVDGAGTGGTPADGDIRGELANLDVYAGKPHGENVYALVLYSSADADELFEEVEGLRANFDHYDTHVETAVYEPEVGDGEAAVVSVWETESAADTAGGFLSDLPGVVRRATRDGWGTMGMFYQVKDGYREEFVETFEDVGEVLSDMDGHVGTHLLANREDDADMFIDSRWESREDAMSFFRSDAFADTVDWGRDVLVDRPRHVFLA